MANHLPYKSSKNLIFPIIIVENLESIWFHLNFLSLTLSARNVNFKNEFNFVCNSFRVLLDEFVNDFIIGCITGVTNLS